jgi:hypothetical protein
MERIGGAPTRVFSALALVLTDLAIPRAEKPGAKYPASFLWLLRATIDLHRGGHTLSSSSQNAT